MFHSSSVRSLTIWCAVNTYPHGVSMSVHFCLLPMSYQQIDLTLTVLIFTPHLTLSIWYFFSILLFTWTQHCRLLWHVICFVSSVMAYLDNTAYLLHTRTRVMLWQEHGYWTWQVSRIKTSGYKLYMFVFGSWYKQHWYFYVFESYTEGS